MSSRPGDFFATIYTDASFDVNTGRGAYAYYIKTSKGKAQADGPASDLENSNHAEMLAIYKAVEDALNRWPDLKGLFVNTDSLACCHIIWPFYKGGRRNKGNTGEVYRSLVKLINGRWIRAKHVKAHTGGGDVRSYLNRKVDHFAGKTMRANRNGLATVVAVDAQPVPRPEGTEDSATGVRTLRPGAEFTEADMEWDND